VSEAPAADYALTIIEALALSPTFLGISDVSRITGINKNAVSRVLGSLCENGWVYQDGVRYQLTLKPFRVVSGALTRMNFYTASQPYLNELWELTGDSCYVGLLQNDAVLYIGHRDSTHDLKISGRVGGSYPLLTTAPGKVLLAYADEKYRSGYFEKNANNGEISEIAFEKEAETIRKNGYALDLEEYGPGIICAAAPVFGMDGNAVGTIGISTSTVYCSYEELKNEKSRIVCEIAAKISSNLGFDVNV